MHCSLLPPGLTSPAFLFSSFCPTPPRQASAIYALDTNTSKFDIATSLGATECINPKDYDKPIQQVLVEKTQWGIDYTFDATGNTEVMRAALEVRGRRI